MFVLIKLAVIAVVYSSSFGVNNVFRLLSHNKNRNFKVFAIEDWYKSEGIKNEDVKLRFLCEDGLVSAALAKSPVK